MFTLKSATVMEEKQLEARESIELISRMIQNTRTRLERNAGRPFLIWGYTTVGISLLNYGFAITGVNSAWSLTWFLIPVIGCLLTWLFHERDARNRARRSTASSGWSGCRSPWR